jgi:hypothetical protein
MRRRERLHILVPCAVGPSRALHDQPLLSAEPLRLLHVPAVSPTLCVQHITAHVSKAGHYTSTSRHAASQSGVYMQRKTRERQEEDTISGRFDPLPPVFKRHDQSRFKCRKMANCYAIRSKKRCRRVRTFRTASGAPSSAPPPRHPLLQKKRASSS